MKNFFVYAHIFPNGKRYVGITCQNPLKRWANGRGYRTQSLMYKAITKYGWHNVKHEILYTDLTKEEACEIEKKIIREWKTNDGRFGYNLSSGGELSSFGVKCSEEKKEKLRKANSGENCYIYGKKHSAETRLRMSLSRKGRIVSPETRKKISEALRGEKHHAYGTHITEEHKRRISEKEMGANNPLARAVKCMESGVVYECIKEAERQTGIDNRNICACLKGKRGTAGGYHWTYATLEKCEAQYKQYLR